MRIIIKTVLFSALSASLLFAGCAGNSGDKRDTPGKEDAVSVLAQSIVIGDETTLLLNDLKENGDYVNGRDFPSLIKASNVYEQLETNILIVDIRSLEEFSAGHIKGAQHKDFSELPAYFETGIKPFEYNRIVIVSSDGQTSSYTASLLRLMGYGNVYAMRWGMSGWNKAYADKGWYEGCKSDYQDNLETKVNEQPAGYTMPELNTMLTTGEEIGTSRFNSLFTEGLSQVLIDADIVFANPSDFFIINYDRRDKYESGHIPGAFRYKPGATLSIIEEMASIPSDKTVVVYCGTGHNSGFVTAYLRLFGYDARTHKYGNNGFMYEKMVAQRATLSWLPFTSEDVNDYSVVR
jgi:rhodanese-related sulfurtransferase